MLAAITASLVQSMAWPVAVSLASVALIVYRMPLGELLGKLSHAKLPWGTEASFVGSDGARNESTKDEEGIRWERTGNLYWIGYDIRRALSSLSHGGKKEDAIEALGQVAHHATALGFGEPHMDRLLPVIELSESAGHDGTVVGGVEAYGNEETVPERCARLIDYIEEIPDSRWESRRKGPIVKQVAQCRDLIARFAVGNQHGFQARP